MAKINSHYLKLRKEYIFPIIEQKLERLKEKSKGEDILNLGIGDIALPLAPKIISGICKATEEMGREETKRGYGPSEGYLFLRKAIASQEYKNLNIQPEEIFISEGINSDIACFHEIFSSSSKVAILNPTYPAYMDTIVMSGGASKIRLIPCVEENGFQPLPPEDHVDLIYLCSPNNPTGIAFTRQNLTSWIAYAKSKRAIILYDNAYCAFITSQDVPKSIYEIEGAHEVAVEFRSFSKSAGFTGLRCGYTVVPHHLSAYFRKKRYSLNALWMRRQAAKYNGVSYPIQKGALEVYSEEGRQQTISQVSSYLLQTGKLRKGLENMGYTCFGGVDSPYIWWKVPGSYSSWDFFDLLLEKCHLISIPGIGFGQYGEGYIRLSGFTTEKTVELALLRLQKI